MVVVLKKVVMYYILYSFSELAKKLDCF